MLHFIPVEQGLRRHKACLEFLQFVLHFIPVEQGLRRLALGYGNVFLMLHFIPVEQGLRQYCNTTLQGVDSSYISFQ